MGWLHGVTSEAKNLPGSLAVGGWTLFIANLLSTQRSKCISCIYSPVLGVSRNLLAQLGTKLAPS